jgi:hypothetical protein
MTMVTCDVELVRDLEGIGFLLEQGQITEEQASVMILRARSRATGGSWPAGQDPDHDARAARAITNSPGPFNPPAGWGIPRPWQHPLPGRGEQARAGSVSGVGGPARAPVPIERLRELTAEQRWQALVFLSGLVPDAVDRALAAALTPGSTAGLVR